MSALRLLGSFSALALLGALCSGCDSSATGNAPVTPTSAAAPDSAAAPAETTAPEGLAVGQKAPLWTVKDDAGKSHSLKDYRGKVVVMDFWATWCGPCKRAMPGLQTIHKEFKDRGVEVFGMNCWERGDASKYMKDQKFAYHLLVKADEVAQKYKVNSIPAFWVIGVDGAIIFTANGYSPDFEKQMKEKIEAHLKEHKM